MLTATRDWRFQVIQDHLAGSFLRCECGERVLKVAGLAGPILITAAEIEDAFGAHIAKKH
jgi:hypothetical protein